MWGAGVLTARYVVEEVKAGKFGGKFLELGCGLALPSLALLKAGLVDDLLATDGSEAVLQRVHRNATRNKVGLKVGILDWFEPPVNVSKFDVVMASDVVYAVNGVEELVSLIDRVATHWFIFGTRDGRRGEEEFLSLLDAKGFDCVDKQTTESFDDTDLETFCRTSDNDDDILKRRFTEASHTIRLFQRRTLSKDEVLRRLDAQREELALCKQGMVDLQIDLQNLAASFHTNLSTLAAAIQRQAEAQVMASGHAPPPPSAAASAPGPPPVSSSSSEARPSTDPDVHPPPPEAAASSR